MEENKFINLRLGVFLGVILPLVVFFIYSCDVARDNPLDPYGTNYNVSNPNLPLPGNLDISCISKHTHDNPYQGDIYSVVITAQFDGFPTIGDVIASFNGYARNYYFDSYNSATLWKTEITEGSLPENNIYESVGQPLYLTIYCPEVNDFKSEYFNYSRVIDITPESLLPDNDGSEDQKPTFVWEIPNDPTNSLIPYNYTFSISVKLTNVTSVYYYVEGISRDSTSFTPDLPLMVGNTIWWVSIVDDFGNYSSSQQKYFKVNYGYSP
jgi:hypothetical protein